LLGSPHDPAMLRTIPLSRRGVYRAWGAALLLVLYLALVLVSFACPTRGAVCRGIRRRDPTGLSPDASVKQEAVIRVFDKDFLPGGGLFAAAPSGSGFQLSLCRLLDILLAARDGLEVNLLGPSLGVDPVRPALKLPALGRLGTAGL